ncbi:MAG: 4Fe-4S dicluster domain-containing protein [Spirochaetota bacterium]
MSKKRYIMVIDMKRCIGCHTCAVACKQGNNLPKDIWWNRVLTFGGNSIDTPYGAYPNLEMQYLTVNCQQCEEAACVKACPSGATYKREDGIVMQDYDVCLGCRLCIMACPYTGVRTYNEERPKYYSEFPVGDSNVDTQQKGTVSKCNFCYNGVDKGLEPNCVEVCPAKARYFGDIEDANSEVVKLLKTRKHIQLLPERGTEPSVYYLI